MSTPFQRNFRGLIARDGWTTRTLAKEIHLSPAGITNLKKGSSTPRQVTIDSIAEFFKVDPYLLAHGDIFAPIARPAPAPLAEEQLQSIAPENTPETALASPAPTELIPVVSATNINAYRVCRDESLVLDHVAWAWPNKRPAVELFGIPVTESLAGPDIFEGDTLFVHVGVASEVLRSSVTVIVRNQQGKLLYGIPVDPADYEGLYEPGAKLLLVRRLIRGDVASVVVPYEEYIATAVGSARLFR